MTGGPDLSKGLAFRKILDKTSVFAIMAGMTIHGTIGRGWCEKHIAANGIKCRHAEWIAMAGKADLLRIDGKVRYFHVDTHREMTHDEAAEA